MWGLRKTFQDIGRRKIRSALTVLGIFIGVAGIVAIVSTARNLTEAQRANFSDSNQEDIRWWAWNNPESLESVLEQLPNVVSAQRRYSYVTNFRTGDNWHGITLYSYDDFNAISISKLNFVEGRPPKAGEIALEYSTKELVPGLKIGDTIIERISPNMPERKFVISGFAKSPANPNATIMQFGVGYVYQSDARKMLNIPGANEILVKLSSFAAREETRRQIEDTFRKRNLSFGAAVIRNPDTYLGKDVLDALSLLLLAFSVVGLIISGFLVANTLSAIVTEQIGEIGTLKAIGASRWQILKLYLLGAFIYGVLGTVPGIIAGFFFGKALLGVLGNAVNFDVEQFFFQPSALILGVVVGLGVTLLAAMFPAWGGTAIPVRQALDNYGIAGGTGDGGLTKLLAKARVIPPLIALSFRNLLRRKVRNIITLGVIILSCAAFVAAQSTSVTVDTTIKQFYGLYAMDGWVRFNTSLNSQFANNLQNIKGVVHSEGWIRTSANVIGARTELWGVPADTTIYRKEVVQGRWFNPDENNVILVSTVLAKAKNIKVGARIEIEVNRNRQIVTVIGLLNDSGRYLNSTALGKAFAPVDYTSRLMSIQGRATLFTLVFAQSDREFVDQTFREIERRYRELEPNSLAAYVDRTSAEQLTNILRLLLYAMVVIIAFIGALGIINTLTLNILERRREIGILRSLGGTNGQLVQVFLLEGVFLGLFGYIFGVVLGYPLAQLLTNLIGQAAFPLEMVFDFSTLAYTFVFAMLLTISASLLPALGAARVKISQTLRYG
jgi:putative ABC transport system permease protein